MFDFEKFPVYQLAEKTYATLVKNVLNKKETPFRLKDQLERASSSIVLNIAEGAGKYSFKEKKNFYLTARASNQECVACIRLLKIRGTIDEKKFIQLYKNLDSIGKMR